MHPLTRFVALDVFRGMAVAAMIVVNSPGNSDTVFAPLQHASWHGCTLADVVFPAFLFAVGCSLVFVWPKWLQASWPNRWWLLAKRVGRLWLLGCWLHGFPFVQMTDNGHWQLVSIGHWRIMGVLQRIALTYALVLLFITMVRSQKLQVLCAMVLLLGYWGALAWGGGFAIQGNLVQTIDVAALGRNHMYTIGTHFFEPEGLLSTLPACVNVLAGYWLGQYLQGCNKTNDSRWHAVAVAILLIVLGLCWHPFFPINKYLWTSSFVLLTVGINMLLLMVTHQFTLYKATPIWALFFEVLGKNALFVYVLSESLVTVLYTVPIDSSSAYEWVYQNAFGSWAPPYWASCCFACTMLAGCWLVAYWMHVKRWYVKW